MNACCRERAELGDLLGPDAYNAVPKRAPRSTTVTATYRRLGANNCIDRTPITSPDRSWRDASKSVPDDWAQLPVERLCREGSG